ncbi:6438_t:CDS:1, partial [Funneliformis caledonium]
MESSPNILGWVEPSLKFDNNTVNLIQSIGVGRTSVVYEGKHNDALVAVKVAKKANYLP